MTVDHMSTTELLAELLARIEHSNGLEFCRQADISKLSLELTAHGWAESRAAQWEQVQL
jgi:hypothetical protein